MILAIFKFHSLSISPFMSRFCSGESSHINHGSLQLSRPEHQLDFGDASHWWSIPSVHRISLDVAPGGQPSTDSGDVGAHRLCPTYQSGQVHLRARYHHSSLLAKQILKCHAPFHAHFSTSYHSRTILHFPLQLSQLHFHHHLRPGVTSLIFPFDLWWFGARWHSTTPISCHL